MSNTLKFGDGKWAVKEGSTLAYNDENGNFKPLPFTFDRAGSATRVNKQGLIEVVGNNEPRIDFLNDSKGALLLEPSRTNNLQRSQEFDNAAWGKDGSVTITPNYSISPDGTQNAERFQKTATGGNEGITQNIFGLSAGTYTLTFYIKSNTDANQNAKLLYGGFQSSSILITPNWQRFEITYTANTSVDYNGILSNEALDISIYGAQLEQGSYATSYIPTQGSIGTRVAESCSQTPPSGVINSSEGVLYAEISSLVNLNATPTTISISDGTSTNFTEFRYDATLNNLQYYLAVGGFFYLNNITPLTDITDYLKVAIKWKVNDFAIWVNGTEIDTATGSVWSANTLDRIDFSEPNGTNNFRGYTKSVQAYNRALSNTELQQLTTI